MRKSIIAATFAAALASGFLTISAPMAHASIHCDQVQGATAQQIQVCWAQTKQVCDEELKQAMAQPGVSQAQAQQTYANCLNVTGYPVQVPVHPNCNGTTEHCAFQGPEWDPPATSCGGYGASC
jgi:hypothetical protein